MSTEIKQKTKVLDCSNCGKPLMQVWQTKEVEGLNWRIRAKCCYCEDFSYIQDFNGLFGFAGKIHSFDSENDITVYETNIIDVESHGDLVTFKTIKVKT